MTQLQGASRFDRRAIKVEEATRLILEAVGPGRSETVPLREAAGRRLAEPAEASCDWPPFARSGLDGFALRSADTAHASPEAPALLRVVGSIAAGEEAAAGDAARRETPQSGDAGYANRHDAGGETRISLHEAGGGGNVLAAASGREAGAGGETSASGCEAGVSREASASGREDGAGGEASASGCEAGVSGEASASGREDGNGGEAPASGSEAGAGGSGPAPVGAGCAVRIMTGGAVPDWADAVVMLEQTAEALEDGQPAVRVKRPAVPGQNVALPGEEFRRGGALAGPGTLLRPGHIALLGTFGYADVPVFTRPRVAVLATGAELLPVAAPLAPGKIRDSNSAMVAALAEQSGALALPLGRLADDPDEVVRALADAFRQADIVVTTGGVSVGDYDVMAGILRGLRERGDASYAPASGAGGFAASDPASDVGDGGEAASAPDSRIDGRLLFNKVAMRPGSPTSAAVMNGKLLLALSGNPGACFVGFELFVRPALLRLQGADEAASLPRKVTARLAADFPKGSPHERYVRTRLEVKDGVLYADPLAFGKSSMMASIPEADGLVRLPAGPQGAARGSLVDVLLV